jgi:hypothetical protein
MLAYMYDECNNKTVNNKIDYKVGCKTGNTT